MDYYSMGVFILFHLCIFVTKLSKKIKLCQRSVGTVFRTYGTFYSVIHFIFTYFSTSFFNASGTFGS
ncbi:hypothetical protein DZ780_08295 [Enterococcus faecium]|nr:hypothetical protein [Enterococcus faecium]EGP5479608.1 hypothetical protein [Enterococcus faecium]